MDVLEGIEPEQLKIMVRTSARAIEGLRQDNARLRTALHGLCSYACHLEHSADPEAVQGFHHLLEQAQRAF